MEKIAGLPQRPVQSQLENSRTGEVKKKTASPEIQNAAKGFEELFVRNLIDEMRKTVQESEEPQYAEKVYRGMLDDQYAHIWAENGGIGLRKMIEEYLSRNQK